jgi:hypothetical protein
MVAPNWSSLGIDFLAAIQADSFGDFLGDIWVFAYGFKAVWRFLDNVNHRLFPINQRNDRPNFVCNGIQFVQSGI